MIVSFFEDRSFFQHPLSLFDQQGQLILKHQHFHLLKLLLQLLGLSWILRLNKQHFPIDFNQTSTKLQPIYCHCALLVIAFVFHFAVLADDEIAI
jgi:hypothetical protein